ncbi:MAG: aconitase X swivel domain-containing protein, partial [Candidatus Competibacterales bacterium]
MPAAHEVVAPVSAWSTPLSFWGGVEPTDGRIIDRSHPGVGHCVGGTILCLPGGRGSSSASS